MEIGARFPDNSAPEFPWERSVSLNMQDIEGMARGVRLPLSDPSESVRFNADDLVPAVAQQYDSGEVLMMAWMNAEALRETLATGRVCYWSRSRSRLWRKGERSGQIQRLVEIRLDCDGDTLLLLVDQQGPACHTGRRSCFSARLEPDGLEIIADPLISPDQLYRR